MALYRLLPWPICINHYLYQSNVYTYFKPVLYLRLVIFLKKKNNCQLMTFKVFWFEINYLHNNFITLPEILFIVSKFGYVGDLVPVFRISRSLLTTPTLSAETSSAVFTSSFLLNSGWNSYYSEVNGKEIYPLLEQAVFVKCLHFRHKSSSLPPLVWIDFLWKFHSKFTNIFSYCNFLKPK